MAAVAVGAIVGRVPNSEHDQLPCWGHHSDHYLIAHRIVSKLRQTRRIAALFDHPPRVLVADGCVLRDELRKVGLTQDDLYGLLRQHGVVDLRQIRLVIFEQRGKLSVIKASESEHNSELLQDVKERSSQAL